MPFFLHKCANSLNAKLTHIWGHFLSSPAPTSGHVPNLLWLILLGLNDGQERRLWCKPLSHVAAPGLGCFLETVGLIPGCTVRLWNKRVIVFFISVSTISCFRSQGKMQSKYSLHPDHFEGFSALCLVLMNASYLCLFPVFALRVLPTFAALVSSRYVFFGF